MFNAVFAEESKSTYESLYVDIDEKALLNATIAFQESVACQSYYQPIEDNELFNAAIDGEKSLMRTEKIADTVKNV